MRFAKYDGTDLEYFATDHLGSTSLVANADGTLNSQTKYTAFGEIRSQSGTSPTDYLYNGTRLFSSSVAQVAPHP